MVDVSDGQGGQASTEVEVAITDDNEPPGFVAVQSVYWAGGRMSSTFSVQPAVDPESDAVTHTASSPGTWLSLDNSDPSIVVFTVGPTAPVGMHAVTITASATGGTAEHAFVIDVQAAGNRAPQFADAADSRLVVESAVMVAGARRLALSLRPMRMRMNWNTG